MRNAPDTATGRVQCNELDLFSESMWLESEHRRAAARYAGSKRSIDLRIAITHQRLAAMAHREALFYRTRLCSAFPSASPIAVRFGLLK